jgi:hypothetical protein
MLVEPEVGLVRRKTWDERTERTLPTRIEGEIEKAPVGALVCRCLPSSRGASVPSWRPVPPMSAAPPEPTLVPRAHEIRLVLCRELLQIEFRQ